MSARSHTKLNRRPIRRRTLRPRPGIPLLRMAEYRAPRVTTLADVHELGLTGPTEDHR